VTDVQLEAAPTGARGETATVAEDRIRRWLVAALTDLVGIPTTEVDVRKPFAYYGLGSTEAVTLIGDLEDWLHVELPATTAFDYPNIDALARHLASRVGGANATPVPTLANVRRSGIDPERATTLTALLHARAAEEGDHLAYLFLLDGEREETRLDYAELDRRARRVAAQLRQHAAPGDRALLLYAPGLDFIAGFFGCLYAGVIAVPAYPPEPSRLRWSLARLQAIAADSGATIAMTTAAIRELRGMVIDQAPELAALSWVVSDGPAPAAVDGEAPRIEPETVAFLQYTSGSTATPKGVMLTHGNVLNNQRVIAAALRQTRDSAFAGWLPLYHDMGLIGNVLHSVYLGIPCYLMSPLHFLQRPFRWLQMVSRYRATISGAPNFAYDLCVRKVRPEERAALNLRSWDVAFNGAEPIRAETLRRFTEYFACCGFRPGTFSPCYGLAEATLMVSGGRHSPIPVVRRFDAEALAVGVAAPAGADATAATPGVRELVGCGRSQVGHQIAIVDPDTNAPCPPGRVGEIWASGPSMARGYWNRPEETARTFGARIAGDGDRRFLRTGDLGFMADGELFIAGRVKDSIIVSGRKLHPHDIEATVERCDAALRAGCGAAISSDGTPPDAGIVIVQEVDRTRTADLDGVIGRIRTDVAEEHQVQVNAVVLVEPRTIPKTPSGKIQRHACRNAFERGELAVVAEWRARTRTRAADVAAGGMPP